MITRTRMSLVGWVVLVSVWAIAYFAWPRFSFDDGPFLAEPIAADLASLSTLSSADLKLFGSTLFVLETRATRDSDPRTVFLLKTPTGSVRWAKVAAAEFGRIQVVNRSPRWFIAGGWVVPIKPERTESGELYLSPFGNFRFFFHSW